MKLEQQKRIIRVLIADEHDLIRLGFRALLQDNQDMELVGEADNFLETLRLAQTVYPDVILLDVSLSDGNIVGRIPELLSVCPLGKILVFTAIEDHEIHLLALRLGALGIFTKKQANDILLKAINCVHSGEVWVNRFTTALLLQNYNESTISDSSDNAASISFLTSKTDKMNALTRREIDVACLAAQGMSAKNIASKLFISEKTVRNQLTAIYNKLGVASQLELALQANNLGIFWDQKRTQGMEG